MSVEKSRFIWVAAQKFNFCYKIDKYNEAVIDKLLQYVNGDPNFENETISFRKGFMLAGGYGTGKSITMKILKEYCTLTKTQYQFRVMNSVSIVEIYKSDGDEGLRQFKDNVVKVSEHLYRPCILCIDDLGAEKKTEKNWGSEEDVIANLLESRYETHQNLPGIVTHATTNFDNDQLFARYGDRLHSRIVEMFNFLPLEGPDRRE